MIETLIGTVLGGVFRMAPEVMKVWDRKNERAHEAVMLDKQISADTLKAQAAQQLAQTQADTQIGLADMQALVEATKAQGQMTGVKWVDAINQLVRPMLAFQWLIFLWPAVVIVGFLLSINASSTTVEILDAMHSAFGTEEKAMASSIASFWLVDRSLKYMSGR
jgi:hypothetical protein